ncbi:MAG: AAA family ATPase, partial [Chloroflexi bacterium]|nr:AAA family ATPase [Chloroflexota bacterium]
MTVKAIRLENFMAFKDTGWIELRPITLLFGRNSSGKSVVIRALRLLKQSLDYGTEKEPLAFVVDEGVDLENFKTTVHRQELKSIITFRFRCDLVQDINEELIRTSNPIDALRNRINQQLLQARREPIPIDDTPTILDLSVSFAWDQRGEEKVPRVVPVAVQIDCPWEILKEQEQETIFAAERVFEDLASEEEKQIERDEQQESWTWSEEWFPWSEFLKQHEINDDDLHWSSVSIEYENGFLPRLVDLSGKTPRDDPDSTTDFGLVNNLLGAFRERIELFLRSIEYFGPIRPEPRRIYSLDQFEKRRWHSLGLDAFIRFLSEDVDDEEREEINRWVNHVIIGVAAKATKYYSGDLGLMAQIYIDEGNSNFDPNLIDVGFGASQAFPIIVQSVLAKPGSLVIIEQPELHLHPGAQARLADMFIESALSKKPVFLLETHSEHLLLRVQTRIAETENQVPGHLLKLKRDDAKIYFMYRKKGCRCSSIDELPIQKTGYLDLSKAPPEYDDFFADNLLES